MAVGEEAYASDAPCSGHVQPSDRPNTAQVPLSVDVAEERVTPPIPVVCPSPVGTVSPATGPLERFAQQLELLRKQKQMASPSLSMAETPPHAGEDDPIPTGLGILGRAAGPHSPIAREPSFVLEVGSGVGSLVASPVGTISRLPASSTVGSDASYLSTLVRGETLDNRRASHQPASNPGTIGRPVAAPISRAGFEQYQRERKLQEEAGVSMPPAPISPPPPYSSLVSNVSDDIRFSFTESVGAQSADGGNASRGSPRTGAREADPHINLLLSALQNLSDVDEGNDNESSSSLLSSDSEFDLRQGQPLGYQQRPSGLNFALAPGGDTRGLHPSDDDRNSDTDSDSFHASVTDEPFNPRGQPFHFDRF